MIITTYENCDCCGGGGNYSCDDALLIGVGDVVDGFFYDEEGYYTEWYKIPVSALTTYHITHSASVSFESSYNLYFANSCAVLSFTTSGHDDCQSFTTGLNSYVYVEIVPTNLIEIDYSFVVELGAC